METYGQMVARVRDEHGWTQKELAQRSGVPLRTLQDVELDTHNVRGPQRDTKLRINAALGIEGGNKAKGDECPVLLVNHSEVPDDAAYILRVITAWLLAMNEDERWSWFLEQNRQIFGNKA